MKWIHAHKSIPPVGIYNALFNGDPAILQVHDGGFRIILFDGSFIDRPSMFLVKWLDESDESQSNLNENWVSEEHILCAAIWFKDGKQHEHQPKNITSGFVICGRRHHNCFMTGAILTGNEGFKFQERAEQGFITNTDRFVTRKEAAEIALKSGQIKESNNCLFSEDLY